MRTLLLIILLHLTTPLVFANSGTSTVTWNNNIIECPSQVLHWVTHYWVPNANLSSVASSWSATCTTHSYYSTSDYIKSYTYNWWITACWAWERVVAVNATAKTMTCRKYDDIPPLASDIWNPTPANNSDLSALSSKNFSFSVWVNWGSPINYIWAFFEDYSTVNNYKSLETVTSWTWSKLENIQNVDSSRLNNWSRQYTLRVTRICDQAWNCTWDTSNLTTLKDFIYNVYANGNLLTKEVNSLQRDNLIDSNNIADWTNYPVTVALKDAYWNIMIPATWIARTIDFNFNVSNTLDLDQLNNTWDAVYLNIPSSSTYLNRLPTSPQSFNAQPSTNGTYTFNFKVYAPTKNIFPFSDWEFKINSITYDINSNLWNYLSKPLSNSSIDFKFNPIYTTTLWWELAWSWFVEWATQTWSIDIYKNWSSNPTVDWLYFVQTWAKKDNFTATGQIDSGALKDIIISDTLIWTKFISNPFNLTNTYILKTLFTLVDNWWYIDDIKDIRLNEYIKYSIWWKAITYLAGILNDNNTQNLETLKIYWITNIDTDKQKDLLENQWDEDIHNIAWEIIKSGLKRDIRKAAINTIKVISISGPTYNISKLSWDTWEDNSDWEKLWNILYFGDLDWENVILDSSDKLKWKKTIIINWWNLYIKSNVINNTLSDILWIIVLKDENWNWWNLYIDTSVQEIDAIIYTDKSVISYNESYGWEVDWNIDNQVMQNQLYILWTVFSENTIWGSRLDPPVCPFYIQSDSSIICDTVEAQKYDFNYLRAWFENKYSSSYGDYPVIIKYNSTIQSTPPPLFTN